MAKATDQLYCAAGHHWNRPKARGQRPKFCPDHQPMKGEHMESMNMQTLTCAAGHQWQRIAKKGKLPKWCDEHRPKPVPPPRPKKGPTDHSLIDLAALNERLGGRTCHPPVAEAVRALTFVTTRRLALATEPNNIKYYQETQRVWIRRLTRDANIDLRDITRT